MSNEGITSEATDGFTRYGDEMVEAAGAMYGAIRRGEVPDSTRSRINMTAIPSGEAVDAQEFMLREAQLNSGVRKIVRYCVLLDDVEDGGFVKSRLARTELFLTRIIEGAALRGALGEDGIVDRVRQPYHPDTTVNRDSAAQR